MRYEGDSPGPLPLVVGVTGHRDLREGDLAALAARVGDIFAALQGRYRHTPLVLLSPLAEGADRLVARVALEKGARLVVPLPLPRALYEADFRDAASCAEFAELLRRAEQCVELPLLTDEGAVRERGPARDRQYAQVGAYIVRHSQILIALWDGVYRGLAGGTSQIVRFQLEGVPEPYAPPRNPLDAVESGPVYHIVTPRDSNPHPVGDAFALRMLFPRSGLEDLEDGGGRRREGGDDDGFEYRSGRPDGAEAPPGGGAPGAAPDGVSRPGPAEEAFDRIFARLDTFNADAALLGPRLAAQRATSKRWLLPGVDAAALPAALAPVVEGFAVADTLAVHFKGRTVRTLQVLFSLTLGAVAFFAIYAHLGERLGPGQLWPLVLCLLLWLIALLRFRAATRADVQNKHLDYRALAEGLRVQLFWRLAGVPDSVADHYLRKQKGELDWIRNSVRVLDIPRGGGDRSGVPPARASAAAPVPAQAPPARAGGDSTAVAPATAATPDYRMVLRCWVDDQRAYFRKATDRGHASMERKDRRVLGLFVIGLLPIILLLAIVVLVPQRALDDGEGLGWLRAALILAATLAPLGAGLWDAYADKMAYSDEAKQYQRMRDVFERASACLSAFLAREDYGQAERIIRELGKEALAENGDWVVLHRGRPVEVPKGG